MPAYFADTPGLEFFNAAAPTLWDVSVANATPLTFDSDANANLGEITVHYFNDVSAYLTTYSHSYGHERRVKRRCG